MPQDSDLHNELVEAFAKSRGGEPAADKSAVPIDKTPVDKGVVEKPADKAPAEVVDKAASDKATADKAVATPADKAATDKAATDKAATDKAPSLEEVKFIDPPAKWTKKEKEDWAKLQELAAKDPALGQHISNVQRILAGRNKAVEADYTKKTMELALERNRHQQLEQVLAPRRAEWQRSGIDDARGVAQVLSYWDLAQKDFPRFLEYVSQERGFDLAQYVLSTRPHLRAASAAQPTAAQDGTQHPSGVTVPTAVANELESLKREVIRLRQFAGETHQWRQETEQSRSAEVTMQAAQEMNAFRAETDAQGQPLHPFFDDVREDMALLLRSGGAQTLKDAYGKAVRMNDSVWSRVQESEEVKRNTAASAQKVADERRRAEEAERARKAGSSIRSSSVDYTPSSSGQPMSLREELAANFAKYRQDAARV